MPDPIRIFIPVDDSDPQSLGLAIKYAQVAANQASPNSTQIILLTHTKQQLQATSLANHLGAQLTKVLALKKQIDAGDGLVLRHETMQTLRYDANNAVVIAFYADDKMLEFVDDLSRVAGVIAVPWLPNSAMNWVERWTPHIHGEAPKAAAVLLSDPVVENALRSLSGIVNLAHGVMHPRDKQFADQTLRILRAKGHSAPGDRIKSWAIREGWKPAAAEELAKLATRIFSLKTKPSLKEVHDPNGRYERWKIGQG